ncbi:glycosyltransferase [Acinetobacter guerrae]|uniref:Glycosyltransferase n=1 Tax=Acinetobacter guerrae TaxID=1843371 RepID=A0A3A8EYD5_9GAMM|nr:glycosyltransferase [Acinetobacter guerrae]RKG33861.1 glycosyltransferase [Acinetobacter guerrae]
MKIVQIMATDGGKIGGLEKHTFQLSTQLSKQQDVHLFLDIHYKNQLPESSSLHCYYYDFSKGRMNPCLLYAVLKTIKHIQPDVVHAQGGKAAKILGFLLPFLKLPSVATIHGMKNNMKSYRNFSEVIAVSEAVAEKIRPYRQAHVVYNGINIQSQFLQNLKTPTLPSKAIAIGRLDPVKGFDQLIQAWQGIDLELEIVGDGLQYEDLNQQIKKMNLQDKVKLVGYQKNISPFLQSSDFVIISSSREGGPLIVAEALLENKPVIATNVGMVSDFIPAQYIAKGYSAEDLHQLIQLTVANFDHIYHDFQPAFDKAKVELSLDAMVEKTLKVYHLARQ